MTMRYHEFIVHFLRGDLMLAELVPIHAMERVMDCFRFALFDFLLIFEQGLFGNHNSHLGEETR